MDQFLAEGLLDSHIERANSVYRRKRDVAVSAVRQHCGQWVDFEVPKGGFYLWLRMSDDVDWDKASTDAALGGVFFRPGERFMSDPDGSRYIRLAYSHAPDHELERGIKVLGEAIAASAK
jgi:2-aminoadipate transaminase